MYQLECDSIMYNNVHQLMQRQMSHNEKGTRGRYTRKLVQRYILCRNYLNILERRRWQNNQIQNNKAEGEHPKR